MINIERGVDYMSILAGNLEKGKTSPISKTEITFSLYDKFCEETGREKPAYLGWESKTRTVIHVDWKDAIAFYQWASCLHSHIAF